MIDFRKKIAVGTAIVKTNPIEIYDTLDRASDKNALRPAQLAVLEDWWNNYKDKMLWEKQKEKLEKVYFQQ